MADDVFLLRSRGDDLRFYEELARAERAAADRPDSPALASAHRLLAIAYEGEARDLRDAPADRR